MTKISQYPEISTPDVDDLLIGTDVENSNATKNFTIQSVIDLVSTGTASTLQQVTDEGNTTTNDVEFNDGAKIVFDNGSRLQKGTTNSQTGGNGGIAQVCSIDYELKWEAGRQYVMQQDGFTIREVSYNFTLTPGVNDDSTKGFVSGSRWILDNGDIYVCTDNTEGDAVWELQVSGLQQVLDEGSRAEKDSGGSYVEILTGNVDSRNFYVEMGNGKELSDPLMQGSFFYMRNGYIEFQNRDNTSNNRGDISISDGTVSLWQNNISLSKFTTLNFNSPTANTTLKLPAKPVDGTYTLATLDDVADSRPYKVYTALLSQSGELAPTAIVLENTLGLSITWIRNSAGDYSGTTTTPTFIFNKLYLTFNVPSFSVGNQYTNMIVRYTDNEVGVIVLYNGIKQDGFNNAPIEIRVYN